MTIDILFFDDCPNHVPTAALARELTQALGIDASIREVLIRNPDEAQQHRFFGSPTIRVNGLDIDPDARARADYGFGCRLYGRSGVPPRELMEAALREAASGETA